MISETQFKNRQGNIVLDIASDQILKSKDLSKKNKSFPKCVWHLLQWEVFSQKEASYLRYDNSTLWWVIVIVKKRSKSYDLKICRSKEATWDCFEYHISHSCTQFWRWVEQSQDTPQFGRRETDEIGSKILPVCTHLGCFMLFKCMQMHCAICWALNLAL